MLSTAPKEHPVEIRFLFEKLFNCQAVNLMVLVKTMKHPDRVFSFKEVPSEDDLVEAMTQHQWPLCYGFYHGKLLYLSDGDSESAPEYAVVTVDKTEGHHGVHGREVGRIKPRGMDAALVMNPSRG